MDKLRQWVALTVVGVLAVLAGGWVLLVSPKHSQAAELRDQAAQQEASNERAVTQLSVLRAQALALPGQKDKLEKVAAKIPDGPELPALIRSLTTAAHDSGVEFVSLTPSAPAASTPTATTGATATVIPVSINVIGGFYEVERYLGELEDLPRALRVAGLTIAPGKSPLTTGKDVGPPVQSGRSLAVTLTAQVFMTQAATSSGTGAPAGALGSSPVPVPQAQ